jgi:uncharacterized membrane protein YkgB
MIQSFNRIDQRIAGVMDKYGVRLLRISLGVIFLWFGFLKIVGISEANELAARTVYWIRPDIFIPILAVWEMLIGLGLLFRPLVRAALLLLMLQMPGTFLPLVLLPEICWIQAPWAPTLEGQYIIKNLVLISAAIVVGGTVRKKTQSEKLM